MLSLRSLCLSLLCGLLVSTLALVAIDQPIPYSHKTHLKLGLKCAECHTTPGKGEMATFPSESKCMTCHVAIKKDSPAIQKLAQFAKDKQPVPWIRIYRVPDFVWFSHKTHAKAECADCHGDVAALDVMVKTKPTHMQSCMQCHDEHQAPNECNTCHNPG
jgi:hypothetical protein